MNKLFCLISFVFELFEIDYFRTHSPVLFIFTQSNWTLIQKKKKWNFQRDLMKEFVNATKLLYIWTETMSTNWNIIMKRILLLSKLYFFICFSLSQLIYFCMIGGKLIAHRVAVSRTRKTCALKHSYRRIDSLQMNAFLYIDVHSTFSEDFFSTGFFLLFEFVVTLHGAYH